MTEIGDPHEFRPDADVFEQQQNVDPDQFAADAPGEGLNRPRDADSADVLEQQQIVTAPLEDEYRED